MKEMAGVYVSYPFCAQKCTYCNFASGVLPKAMEAEYLGALLTEIQGTAFPWIPETVYLGGGTPSTMELESLARMLGAIPGRPWREATIECAPGTLTPERVGAWMSCGINRVSLGVQSFSQKELARTGRRHTAATVEADVQLLRAAGLHNFNVDLIAGLPGQTAASWSESLDWITRLDPPHVSVYMLEVDEDSRLGKEMLLGGTRYGASDAPDDEATASFYEFAVERLAGMGLERYEISNFARPSFESAHNLKYWRREPYLGFGADAHSFDEGLRWSNPESAADYIKLSVSQLQRDTVAADEREEKFFVGLRLSEGVETDPHDLALHGVAIERLLGHGLLEEKGARIRLSQRGIMVSNEVFQEFLLA